jgi:hypothetical protein
MADKQGLSVGGILWKAVMVVVAIWLIYWMLRTFVL